MAGRRHAPLGRAPATQSAWAAFGARRALSVAVGGAGGAGGRGQSVTGNAVNGCYTGAGNVSRSRGQSSSGILAQSIGGGGGNGGFAVSASGAAQGITAAF